MKLREIEAVVRGLGDPEIARFLAGYFKTGPGEYAEGDLFLGVKVPAVRKLARSHKTQPLPIIAAWLQSAFHEVRLLALLTLVLRFPNLTIDEREAVVQLYLNNRERINNWDLVDVSAPHILGAWLMDRNRSLLDELVQSESLWERRIAIVTTGWFIRKGQFDDTLRLAEVLLDDEEPLLHKASGWMLREVGQRDRRSLTRFLDVHAQTMPRTMLRYAIERLPERSRQAYIKRK